MMMNESERMSKKGDKKRNGRKPVDETQVNKNTKEKIPCIWRKKRDRQI